MIGRLFLSGAIFFLGACGTKNAPSAERQSESIASGTASLSNKKAPTAPEESAPVHEDAKDTRNDFALLADAIESGSAEKVLQYVALPLMTRGTLDSDPMVEHKRQDFIRAWPMIRKSMSDSDISWLRKFEPNEDADCRPDWCRVGELEFSQDREGRWKIDMIYWGE